MQGSRLALNLTAAASITLNKAGFIDGSGALRPFGADGSQTANIVNGGTMVSASVTVATVVTPRTFEKVNITNAGLIATASATFQAILMQSTAGHRVVNTATIQGFLNAVPSAGALTRDNSGTIEGYIVISPTSAITNTAVIRGHKDPQYGPHREPLQFRQRPRHRHHRQCEDRDPGCRRDRHDPDPGGLPPSLRQRDTDRDLPVGHDPGRNSAASGPAVFISPTASQPSIVRPPPSADVLRLTLVSTGFTDTADLDEEIAAPGVRHRQGDVPGGAAGVVNGPANFISGGRHHGLPSPPG